MTAAEMLGLEKGTEVVVNKGGNIYRLLYVHLWTPADELNREFYAKGGGLIWQQVKNNKLYGPLKRLKAENISLR